MLNPCCGRDLAHVAKTVAVFDVILSILELAAAMVLESTPVTILSTDVADPEKRDVNYVVSMTLLFGICLVIMRIVQLGCSILLLYGVVEKNYKKCEVWFIFSCVVITLAALQILYEIMVRDKLVGQGAETSPPFLLRIAVPGLELLLTWYLMWVILAFMHQLKRRSIETQTSSKDETEMMKI
ncbi:uncharacterized protein LOC110851949 [Folsomia candida]|nr:uncharacterized protein LOC110851949 [Folsomia candida]